MRVSLIQSKLYWEDVSKNLDHFDGLLQNLPDTDLIVLPEMFTSGFTMHPERVAQTMAGDAINWMKKQAINHKAAICGSLVVVENNHYYNRLVFITPNEEIYFYNKRHLFTLANEHNHYQAGKEKVIVNYLGWRICLQICYDLRFPAFTRNHENYDLIIYVANWPKPRINAWDILLKARAIENMSYVIGVNRVGEDENGMIYNGHSQVIDELGQEIIKPFEDETIKHIELNKNILIETRLKLPFLNDKDDFKIL